jgi:hypothetical protein
MRNRSSGNRRHDVGSDNGFSMIATVLSMGATAILVVLLFTTMFKSSASSNTSISNAPGVSEATSLQAQQTLATGLSAAETASTSAGGYGSLGPATLAASEPSIAFVSGASSNASTVSVAVTGTSGGDGSAVGGQGEDGIPGAATGSGGGGSITLADRSTNGTWWLVWKSAGGAAWYGAETNLPSCTAPALTSMPSAGPVSSTSIGWQEGSFPEA